MRTRGPLAAALAAVALASCTKRDLPTPVVAAVVPDRGYVGLPTAVAIEGKGFAVRTEQSSGGGGPAVDTGYRAWLGDATSCAAASTCAPADVPPCPAELVVTWKDAQTLEAQVPKCLPAGAHPLVLESPFGAHARLDAAFTVVLSAAGALTTTVQSDRAQVSVGQPIKLTATVKNTGAAEVTGVAPSTPLVTSTDGAAATLADGPSPPSIASLAPGATGTFEWTFTATGRGHLSLSADASGTDSFSSTQVTGAAAAPAVTQVQSPAALSATLALPAAAGLGVDFQVTMVVTNTGDVDAQLVAPLDLTLLSGSLPVAKVSGPTPSSATIAGAGSAPNNTATFTWTYNAGASSGSVQMSGGAQGKDANSGVAISTTPALSGTMQVGASALSASLGVSQAVASTGQIITLTLTVNNTGSGPVTNVTPDPVSATLSSNGQVTLLSNVTPPSIPSLAAGATGTFTWTYLAQVPDVVTFSTLARGVDQFSGKSVTTGAAVANLTVQTSALLTPTLAASKLTASTGQAVTLTLSLQNSGSAPARVTAVTPTGTPATGWTCTAPSPVPPQTVGGLATLSFSWTCTATAAGTYTYGATVAAVDANSGVSIGPGVAGIPVAVQAAAVLAPTLTALPTTASTGQAVTLTLSLKNNGTAGASVTAVTPSGSPATGWTCTAASPAPPQTIAGGATATFTWTCTGTVVAVYTYGAAVAATDVNSGAAINPTVAGVPVTVQQAAVLAPTLTASKATVSTGQAVTLTLALKNNGSSTANVSAVAPTGSPATNESCTAATPAPPQAIAGGATVTFTWSCTATAAATYTYGATVTATDSGGAGISPAVAGVPVVVQAAAVLAPTLTALPTTANTGQAVTLTLSLKNNGGASASVTAVTPTSSLGTATCTAASPVPPQTIAGGATLAFTWTCTATAAGAYTYGATVAATDVNSALAINPTVAGAPVTVQTPAVLAPTLAALPTTASTGQAVTLTLSLKNNGASGANVTAVTPTASPATNFSCTAASPAPPQTVATGATVTFTWTCTATAAATYTYGATVAATDVVSGLAINPTVAGVPVVVQVAAVLAPTLTALSTTANTGQAVTLTLSLKNNGGATASVSAVTPTSNPATNETCTAASPVPPQTIAGGVTLAFTWTCTATVAATYTYGATVAATDVNSGLAISPTVAGVPVVVQTGGVLAPTLAASRSTADTGQAVTLTLSLKNNGASGANVTAVTPTASPATNFSCTAASPVPPQAIAGGATVTFTWTCTATAAATYSYGATVAATDAVSGANISPTVTGVPVVVQAPAVLAPTLTALPTTASTGQAVTLTLSLKNNGGASASVTAVTPTASPSTNETCSAVSPAVPQTIAGGATLAFTWTCTATAAATYTYGATVAAADGNTGADVSPAVTGVPVVVQPAGQLAPTLTALPTTASTGQAVTLTLSLKNNGASGANVTAVTPTASPSSNETCGAVSPALPQTIAGGATLAFTWTCTATAATTYTYGATVAATDVVSGLNISPTVAGVPVTVQTAASLAPTLTPSSGVASTGQPVTLTLSLKNNGTSGANVSAVGTTATPSANVSCTAPSPAPPQTIGGGATLAFTWTCTATAAGTYTYGALVAASDALSGANVSPTVAGVPVAVQQGATLAPTFSASRSTASTGQAVDLTLSLKNNGTSGANVTGVTPTASPATNFSCTSPSPAPPQTIGGGATVTFTWSCTATAAGSYTYGATVAAIDVVGQNSINPTVTGAGVTVQAKAVLSGSVAAGQGTVNVNQAVSLTLTVNNTGQATANAVAAAPTVGGTASATCTAASPASQAIAGGGSGTFTWSCTPTTTGSLSLGATVSGTDANSGAAVNATATPASVTVQSSAALTATIAVGGGVTTASTGQQLSLTLTVTNTGGASANVTTVTPSATGVAASCTAASPSSRTIAGGSNGTFAWTCTPSAAGTLTLGGSVSGTDASSGGAVGASASPQASVTVQTAAVLSAGAVASRSTADVGQAVSVTLTVNDTGQAGARVTSVTPTVSPGGAASCGSPSPTPPQNVGGGSSIQFTWSCTVSSAVAMSLGATVSGTDANSGNAVGPVSASTASVTGQTPASLSVSSFTATPALVNTGQGISVSLTLANSGGATASVTGVSPRITPSGGASCTAASPSSRTIAGGTNGTFTWTCSATTAHAYSLDATIAAVDVNTTGSVAPTVNAIPATVQNPAALSPALAGPVGNVAADTDFDVTMTVSDTGDASATNVVPSLSVSVSGSGAGVSLVSGPSPSSATATPLAAAVFTWTYHNGTGGAGTATFSGSVTGTDATSGLPIGPVPASDLGVGLDSQGPVQTMAATSAAGAASVSLVAGDPLGDGTPQALVAAWQGAVWVGPSRDGSRLARIDPTSGAVLSLGMALAVDGGATPASNPAWAGAPASATAGAPGCAPGTGSCGPDGEAGAVLLAPAALGGAERLWLAGAGPAGTRYLYAAAAEAGPLPFAFVDLADPLQASGAGGSAPLLTAVLADPLAADRLYLAFAERGSAAGPLLLALEAAPSAPGLDAAVGEGALDLQAAALPGIAGAGITALASLGGVLYLGHEAGIVRAAAAAPGPAGASPGDWALATPDSPAWAAKAPVPLPASGAPGARDRAVPALAAFGSCSGGPCVFAARNVLGDPSQPPVVPQLWRCDPSAGPARCTPGDWTLVAPNGSGDRLLTQLGDGTNGAAALLAATPRWLYLGFDNASTGVQIYRAAVAPGAAADFQGEGGCQAGAPGCQGLGGNGLGSRSATRILGYAALVQDGIGSLWIAAGDGNGPAAVYRIGD